MKHRAIIVFGVVVSIVLLVFALRDVSVPELLEHLDDANLWWLLAATAVATFTFVLRAIRWRILLLPAVGVLPFGSRFATVCIGFMANNVIGARVGEFARAYSLTRVESVGLAPVLASLVVERLLDGVATVALLLPAYFALGPEELASAGPLVEILTAFVAIVGVGILVAAAMVVFPRQVLVIVRWMSSRLPEAFAEKLVGIVEAFILGLGVLRRGWILLVALGWTAIVWLTNAFSFYLGFLAFEIERPGMVGAMLLQSIISLFVALPSTPGFFGPFEFGARVGLELYSVEPARIISFAASYHLATFLPVTLLGIWYMRKLGLSRSEISGGDQDVKEELREELHDEVASELGDAGEPPPAAVE
ncbi:MAG: lysylphosphatidylglycerol synthase transmembrane domain-containing protein [Gemmatimonadota bacterium]|nr:lysylphosphatidylglycerol synthase transmembrane domain-containing protein [Gemmatimonadota bacterium]